MMSLKEEVERQVVAYRSKLLRETNKQTKQLDRIIKRILTKYQDGPIPLYALVSLTMMKWSKTTVENYHEMSKQVINHIHRSKLVRITSGFHGGVRLR